MTSMFFLHKKCGIVVMPAFNLTIRQAVCMYASPSLVSQLFFIKDISELLSHIVLT